MTKYIILIFLLSIAFGQTYHSGISISEWMLDMQEVKWETYEIDDTIYNSFGSVSIGLTYPPGVTISKGLGTCGRGDYHWCLHPDITVGAGYEPNTKKMFGFGSVSLYPKFAVKRTSNWIYYVSIGPYIMIDSFDLLSYISGKSDRVPKFSWIGLKASLDIKKIMRPPILIANSSVEYFDGPNGIKTFIELEEDEFIGPPEYSPKPKSSKKESGCSSCRKKRRKRK